MAGFYLWALGILAVFLMWIHRASGQEGGALVEWSVPPAFKRALPFQDDGTALVLLKTGWHRLDGAGRILGPAGLEALPWETNERGLAGMRWKGKFGLVDGNGKVLARAEWDEIREEHNGYVPVKRAGRWGYVGHDGRVIPCEWDDAWRFSPEGYAVVTKAGKRGIIDRNGKLVVEPIWDGVLNFTPEGVAAVRTGDYWNDPGIRWALVDRNGKLLCEPEYGFNWADRRFDIGFIPARLTGGSGERVYLGIDGKIVPEEEAQKRLAAPPPAPRDKEQRTAPLSFRIKVPPQGGKLPEGCEIVYNQDSANPWLQDRRGSLIAESRDLIHAKSGRLLHGVEPAGDFTVTHIPYAAKPQYGWVGVDGSIRMQPKWDEVEVLANGRIRVTRGGKKGIADAGGSMLVEAEWDDVEPLMHGPRGRGWGGQVLGNPTPWYLAKRGGKSIYLGPGGKPSLPDEMAETHVVDFFGPRKLVVKQPADPTDITTGQYGIYEPQNRRLVPLPKAAEISWNWHSALDGFIWIQKKEDSKWHLYRDDGSATGHTHGEKPAGWALKEGMGLMGGPGGHYFIDRTGKRIGEGTWEKARHFSNGLAAVMKGGKWGFIKRTGAPVGEFRWDEVMEADPGFALVVENGKTGAINHSGKIIHPPRWDLVRAAKRGYRAVKVGRYWGFIDSQARLTVHPIWDRVEDFSVFTEEHTGAAIPGADYAIATIDPLKVAIDGAGRLLCRPCYNQLKPRDPYLIGGIWRREAGVGVYDQYLVRPSPDQTAWHDNRIGSDGDARVLEELTPTLAWRAESNFDGALWALCGPGGKPLTRFEWQKPPGLRADKLGSMGTWIARASTGLHGLIGSDGRMVLPPVYDGIAWVAPGVAVVWSEDDGGLLTSKGLWRFRDNDVYRIAKFGKPGRGNLEYPLAGSGIVLIEDSPKWGYVRIRTGGQTPAE